MTNTEFLTTAANAPPRSSAAMRDADLEPCVVVIPTFNERDNIGPLLAELLALPLPLELLVVDDDSPDGTAAVVQAMAEHNPRVHLLLRRGERGRGSAGIAGFKQALAMGAAAIVEMDADFSHHPRHLPAMLEALRGCDVVIGSRFVPGGADLERGRRRQFITRLAGIYVRSVLGIRIRDVSSGFRCFRRKTLESLDFAAILSTGPSVVLELLYRLVLKGWQVCEVPIVFADRRQGQSKLNLRILLQTLLMVLRLKKWGHY
jgi:dolichol-phosphate mannosyltransferase